MRKAARPEKKSSSARMIYQGRRPTGRLRESEEVGAERGAGLDPDVDLLLDLPELSFSV